MAALRSKTFLKANPGAERKLAALGVELSGKVAANDNRFQKVYDALKTYKEIYGDLLVPQPFVVPNKSEDWPESTWGLRLGARVNAIRSQGTFVSTNPERRQELDDLGFVWSPPPSERGRKRGRKRKEEVDATSKPEEELITPPSFEREDTTSEAPEVAASEMESLFGPSFAFGDGPLKVSNGEETGTPSWGFETPADLEAAKAAEEAAKPTDEYTPERNLSETLKQAAENAISVGVIEDMG
jgi:hypothetical protein